MALARHNNLRDILGHSAKAAGLAAVVIEKKNQIAGSKQKPGDITVQQYHRGFSRPLSTPTHCRNN